MKFLIIILVPLSFICESYKSKVVPVNIALSGGAIFQNIKNFSDTSTKYHKSGFYLAIPDTSNSLGYKVHNKNEFYFLGLKPFVTINEIDRVYIEFNPHIDRYTLIINLNEVATRKWYDFTTKYNGMELGLVLKEEIFHVAKITSPMSSGKIVLTNAQNKNDVDKFKELIEKEIEKNKEIKE